MKRKITTALMKIGYLVIFVMLSACGGGGGEGGGVSPGIAWINITSCAVSVLDNTPSCELSGDAFISDSWVYHWCIGLACLDLFDNSYPGVDVTWINLTTGSQGMAVSRFGTATNWDHLYSASVPLIVGVNELQVTAADPSGNIATTNIFVEY